MKTRIAVLLILGMIAGLLCPAATSQTPQQNQQQDSQTVRIGVLSLFHPTELRLRPAAGSDLILELGGRRTTLAGNSYATITLSEGSAIQVQFPENENAQSLHGTTMQVRSQSSPDLQDSISFWLEVPGKLRRQYTGTLEIRTTSSSASPRQALEAVVTMPLEIAVVSIVQAESPANAVMESLKAQAVATRSFLAARQTSHVDFDFCDTTHCQFLRSPPSAASPAARAARATQGLVLTWHDDATAQDRTLPAMYARSCGGRTRTLSEIGAHSHGYPYYAVRCTYCIRHPELWQRETSGRQPQTEHDRLAFNRIHGWGAIPSIPTTSPSQTADRAADRVSGRGIGHSIGLCQLGAADMARRGFTFTQILAHYYPNTRITQMP